MAATAAAAGSSGPGSAEPTMADICKLLAPLQAVPAAVAGISSDLGEMRKNFDRVDNQVQQLHSAMAEFDKMIRGLELGSTASAASQPSLSGMSTPRARGPPRSWGSPPPTVSFEPQPGEAPRVKRAKSAGPAEADAAMPDPWPAQATGRSRHNVAFVVGFPYDMVKGDMEKVVRELLAGDAFFTDIDVQVRAFRIGRKAELTFLGGEDCNKAVEHVRSNPLQFKEEQDVTPIFIKHERPYAARRTGWVLGKLWSAVHAQWPERGTPISNLARSQFGQGRLLLKSGRRLQAVFDVVVDADGKPSISVCDECKLDHDKLKRIMEAVLAAMDEGDG